MLSFRDTGEKEGRTCVGRAQQMADKDWPEGHTGSHS